MTTDQSTAFLICSHFVLCFGFVNSLHVAASRGQTDCLSVILAHGADLSITDAAGMYCTVGKYSCGR